MKTIIEMAREADALPYLASSGPRHLECLTRFATLVKAARDAALIAGVEMPEPVAFRNLLESGSHTYCKTAQFFDNAEGVYTTDQLRSTVAAAVLREREACAKVCEDMWGDDGDADDFAGAIRNRSNV